MVTSPGRGAHRGDREGKRGQGGDPGIGGRDAQRPFGVVAASQLQDAQLGAQRGALFGDVFGAAGFRVGERGGSRGLGAVELGAHLISFGSGLGQRAVFGGPQLRQADVDVGRADDLVGAAGGVGAGGHRRGQRGPEPLGRRGCG